METRTEIGTVRYAVRCGYTGEYLVETRTEIGTFMVRYGTVRYGEGRERGFNSSEPEGALSTQTWQQRRH